MWTKTCKLNRNCLYVDQSFHFQFDLEIEKSALCQTRPTRLQLSDSVGPLVGKCAGQSSNQDTQRQIKSCLHRGNKGNTLFLPLARGQMEGQRQREMFFYDSVERADQFTQKTFTGGAVFAVSWQQSAKAICIIFLIFSHFVLSAAPDCSGFILPESWAGNSLQLTWIT